MQGSTSLSGPSVDRPPVAGRVAPGLGLLLITAALGGGFSILCTGVVFGYGNQLFHLPIVGALYDLPQFQNDPFIQSLRNFASGIWQVLAGIDRFVPPEPLLAAALWASRTLTLFACLLIARDWGLSSPRQALALVACLALTPLLHGIAYAGNGGLFINTFSHSELANGVTLLMLHALQRRQIGPAVATLGVVFFLNAFMAVWNAVAFLVVLACLPDRRALLKPAALARTVVGALVAVGLAMPVLPRLMQVFSATPAPVPYDYEAYLLGYYPYHFIASSISWTHWIALSLVVAMGWLALRAIGPRARIHKAAIVGYGVVYAIGVMLPALTHLPTLLNLHLLRVSVNFHLLAALSVCWLVVRDLGSATASRPRILTALLAVCSLTHVYLLPGVVLVLWLSARPCRAEVWRSRGWERAALVVVLVHALLSMWRHQTQSSVLREGLAEWAAVAAAVQRDSAPDAIVLIPVDASMQSDAGGGASGFEYLSKRQVWIDTKRGAAVMWQPSYHTEWSARLRETAALHTWDDRQRYASERGIGYIVDTCDGLPDRLAIGLVVRTAHLCAVRLAKN